MRYQLKRLDDEAKQDENIGGMVVLTTDVNSMISITWCITFANDLPTISGIDQGNWKEPMLSRLNGGDWSYRVVEPNAYHMFPIIDESLDYIQIIFSRSQVILTYMQVGGMYQSW